MEAGARGCVPAAHLHHAAGCVRGQWSPAGGPGRHLSGSVLTAFSPDCVCESLSLSLSLSLQCLPAWASCPRPTGELS